jgi:hypothetical protein
MRDEDLRDQLAASARVFANMPVPGLDVLRRRVRRRRRRIGAACFALSVVVGAGAAFAAVTGIANDAGYHPAGGASPSLSATGTPQASGTPTDGPLPQGWFPAGRTLAPDASVAAAPYYVTLDQSGYIPLNFSGVGDAIVVDAFTGKAVTIIADPAGPESFTAVAAAGDDRTFFLASQTMSSSTAVFELRLGAHGQLVSFTRAYTIPGATAITSLAVSPDGSMLAYVTSKGIEVVSLAAGTSGLVPGPAGTIGDLCWVNDDLLGYVQWLSSSRTLLRTLDIGSEPGHPVIQIPQVSDPLIAADGSVLFATVVSGAGQGNPLAAVEEFSTRTGRLIARLTPWADESGMGAACLPLWTDSSGAHSVVECRGVFTAAGGRAAPADLHVPGANFSVSPNWLIAW